MSYFITKEYVLQRSEPGFSANKIGLLSPGTIVYDLGEVIEANGLPYRKVFAYGQDGVWRIGYCAERTLAITLLESFVPHVKLGSPYKEPVHVTQLFGENPDMYRWLKMAGHNGIDLATVPNAPIYAVAPGHVLTGRDDGYGNYVRVEGATLVTVYAHLSSLAVSTSEFVSPGRLIGFQGSTGNTKGSHLHLDIRMKNGSDTNNGYLGRVDPLPYLDWGNFIFPPYCAVLNEHR